MATGGQEQEETKKSLGYYLHWVLAREAGAKTSSGRSARKDRDQRKKAEEKLISKALSKVAFHHIATSEETASQHLAGLKGLTCEEDFITEKAHNEYDVRIWLKAPVPPGSLQV